MAGLCGHFLRNRSRNVSQRFQMVGFGVKSPEPNQSFFLWLELSKQFRFAELVTSACAILGGQEGRILLWSQ